MEYNHNGEENTLEKWEEIIHVEDESKHKAVRLDLSESNIQLPQILKMLHLHSTHLESLDLDGLEITKVIPALCELPALNSYPFGELL